VTQRILIRAGRPPHDTTSNEAALAWGKGVGHFAGNSGNMLFCDAVYVALNTPETAINHDCYDYQSRIVFSPFEVAKLNKSYDAYVLPMANSFRPSFKRNLDAYTSLISRLKMKVVVTGVGAQLPLSGSFDSLSWDHKMSIKAFVRAVLNRSASIGVRGEITKSLLMKLGFPENSIDVIGCPSVFSTSRDHTVSKTAASIDDSSALGICTNPFRIKNKNDLGMFFSENEKAYPGIVLILQKNYEAEYIIWGKNLPYSIKGVPSTVLSKTYLEGRMRFFTNSITWQEYMQTLDFFFGPRLHGCIAAINAGTPAFFLTIDSRTQELADYHGFPSAHFNKVMAGKSYLARDLYEAADFSAFNKKMPENWDRYYAFLEKNGLEHIHMEGKANPEYKAKILSAKRPAGAKPIASLSAKETASRMKWLWQDDKGK